MNRQSNSYVTFIPVITLFITFFIMRLIPDLFTIYPIGQDTQQYLLAAKNFVKIPITTPYPLLYNLLGLLYYFGIDAATVMKILPSAMHGAIGSTVFLFCYKHLKWDFLKSYICALIIGFSHVTFRISFELHNQLFSLIILFILLTYLNTYLKNKKLFHITDLKFLLGCMILSFSHWFISVFFLNVLVFQIISKIIGDKMTERIQIIKLIVASAIVFLSCLLGYLLILNPYKPAINSLLLPNTFTRPIHWLFKLLLYSYYPLLFFVIAGIMRERIVISMLSFPVVGIFTWLIFGMTFFLPVERYIWLFVFSLGIFATNGIYRMTNLNHLNRTIIKIRLKIKKDVSVMINMKTLLRIFLTGVLLTFLLWHDLSMIQIVSEPSFLGPVPYGFPSNMLYNGVFSTDMQRLHDLLYFLNKNTTSKDLIITHYTISGLIYYYTNCQVVRINNVGYADSFIITTKDNKVIIYHLVANNTEKIVDIVTKLGFSRIFLVDVHNIIKRSFLSRSVKLVYNKEPFSVYMLNGT